MKQPLTIQDIEKEWQIYHRELYLPGSAINTNTIEDWWIDKLRQFAEEVKPKKRRLLRDSEYDNAKDYGVELGWNYAIKETDKNITNFFNKQV